jgi:branched-chain amino acid transport system ATP-binding protein
MSFPHFWGKRPLLKLIGVEAFYGKIKALHGVSLEVPDGKLVCILGANGAGKTTILKTISGVVEPEMGTIHFDGERIDRLDAEKIVSLGISHVPENRHIFPELTVYENLVMGGFLVSDRSLLETRLEEIFDRFAVLRERKDQLAGTLSGGEQQLLAISRALMLKPKLLLLDEPSLGLSPLLVQEIFDTIKELHRSGVTILLVEQNVNQALRIADYGYVLTSGKIFLSGTYEELRREEKVREMYLGEGKYVRRSKLWGVT